MLDAPLFEIRWRWNATRALAILRNRNGKRVPPYLQRMQAEDLIAQVFPDQIACFENIQGERKVPNHPLVSQVIDDCLNEAMDIKELEALIKKIEQKEIILVAKDLREPSIFAQEIINARPYSFLDDTEFAERRVNAVRNRSWLDPSEARDLSRLDPAAIALVREEAWPEARDFDELHDILMIHGFLSQTEGLTNNWQEFFEPLLGQGRAARFQMNGEQIFWIATERLSFFQKIYPRGQWSPAVKVPACIQEPSSFEEALREIVRGRLEALGPVTLTELAGQMGLPTNKIDQALLALEHEGFVFRGKFTPDLGAEEWCERRLLQRIHKYTIESLRQSIQPVSVQNFVRFLFDFHHMRSDEEWTGPQTLQEILAQLEGFEAPAASWEADLIPARMAQYDPIWLDSLCVSGKIVWGRFKPPKKLLDENKRSGPVKTTPICLVPRNNAHLWKALGNGQPEERELSTHAIEVFEHLKTKGASFFDEIVGQTGLLKTQVEEAIAQLVTEGAIVSDSYAGLRALLTPESNKPTPHRLRHSLARGRRALFGIEHAGRWSLMHSDPAIDKENLEYEILEELVFIYLRRWGVLFRSLLKQESFAPPWRILGRVLRRLELRGQLRGGRFVSQVSGEQFALPETIEHLRRIRQESKSEELISISATDPLNLLGIILPGKRIAHLTHNRIVFRDGIPLAVLEGGNIHFLTELPPDEQWQVQKVLVRRKFPPKLRYYLGKNYS